MNKPTWMPKGRVAIAIAIVLIGAGCAPAPPPYGATDAISFRSADTAYTWSETSADVTALVSGACADGPQVLSVVATLGDGSTVYFGFNETVTNTSPAPMPFPVGTYGSIGNSGYAVYVEQVGDFTVPGLGYVPEIRRGSIRGTGSLTIAEIATGPTEAGPCGPFHPVTRIRATFSFLVSSSLAGRPGDYVLWSGSINIG